MAQVDQGFINPIDENRRLWKGLRNFIDRVTPWLLEIGILIFGSLLAFNLLVLASLFTVGPVDVAIKVATISFALALPLNICGLLLLRMVREFKDVRIENEMLQAFQDEGFTGGGQIPGPSILDEMRQHRAGLSLQYSAVMMALSILLSLAGLIATLWHMAWWISMGFCVMVGLAICILVLAIAPAQPADLPDKEM